METCKRFAKVFQYTCYAAIIAGLAGCLNTLPEQVRTKSETELAVSAIKTEWLKDCVSTEEALPPNQVGALLKDYITAAEDLILCMKRHNDFVGYMRPIVEKERAR